MGEPNRIELPGLAAVLSQLVVPLVALNRLLGILCLIAGRFLSDDEG